MEMIAELGEKLASKLMIMIPVFTSISAQGNWDFL